jgi:hypothetical protein
MIKVAKVMKIFEKKTDRSQVKPLATDRSSPVPTDQPMRYLQAGQARLRTGQARLRTGQALSWEKDRFFKK